MHLLSREGSEFEKLLPLLLIQLQAVCSCVEHDLADVTAGALKVPGDTALHLTVCILVPSSSATFPW